MPFLSPLFDLPLAAAAAFAAAAATTLLNWCLRCHNPAIATTLQLDQVGLLEIRACIEKTGGLMVLADSFGQSVFKESLRRVFSRVPDDAPCDAGHLQVSLDAPFQSRMATALMSNLDCNTADNII